MPNIIKGLVAFCPPHPSLTFLNLKEEKNKPRIDCPGRSHESQKRITGKTLGCIPVHPGNSNQLRFSTLSPATTNLQWRFLPHPLTSRAKVCDYATHRFRSPLYEGALHSAGDRHEGLWSLKGYGIPEWSASPAFGCSHRHMA